MGVTKRSGLGIIAAVCAVVVWAGAAQAEAPKPFPEFSAKRVSPPKSGAAKRITVQIAPPPIDVAAPSDAVSDSAAPDEGAAAMVPWFWEEISPELADSRPGRLEPALIRLSNPPEGAGLATPRLATLQGIVADYGIDILRTTIGTEISPALVLAVIAIESGGRADAESSAGAQGLMQLMPATAKRFEVTDSFVAPDNISGGVAFLDFLMQRFDGDPILVLAGYNAGETAIAEHSGVPPFDETRLYVPKVLAAFQVARALCMTPPELISDGCVFAQR